MKKSFFTLIFLSAVLLCTNGCGEGDSSSGEASPSQTAQEQGQSFSDDLEASDTLEASDIPEAPEAPDTASASRVNAFQSLDAAPITQGAPLFVQKYLSLSVKTPDGDYGDKVILADSYGSKLYLFSAYQGTASGEDDWQCFLSLFDADARQLEEQPFSLEIPDKEHYCILSMEVKGEDELSFRMQEIAAETPREFLVRTDMAGNVLDLEDNFPAGKTYPWNPSVEEARMVFDQTDGSTILCEWDGSGDGEGASLYWFDRETGGRKLITSLRGEYLSALYLDRENSMYYIGNGALIRWDMKANTRQELAQVYDIGVPTMASYVGLLPDSAGDVLVCFLEGSSLGVIVLSEEEPESAEEIRLAYLEPEGPRYSIKLASEYSREHTECPIKMEQNGGDKETFRNRILMELAADKGPEMMWVSKEDMAILAEKGALMDLKELIPADIYEQLFPFAIQDCTIDGKMVGVAPWYSLHTMAVSKKVWTEDSWTLSEFLDVAESRTDWELILCPNRLDGYSLFRNLLPGLEGTPFLDMEQGIAHFDHEEFIRLLEFCHQNGGAPLHSEKEALASSRNVSWDEAMQILREGNCVAESWGMYEGLHDFASSLAEFGEDIYMVGSPAYSGSGHYVGNFNGYLAVNAKAEHMDEIKEYISLLLDYEKQFTVMGCCVRRDVAENKVVRDEFSGELKILAGKPSSEMAPKNKMELKPDGTSYLEEYLAFLDSCEPMPEYPSRISSILWEELDGYFSGTRNVEDTVDIIQNRVQLYLDEGGR